MENLKIKKYYASFDLVTHKLGGVFARLDSFYFWY